jgi:hypothetical protein
LVRELVPPRATDRFELGFDPDQFEGIDRFNDPIPVDRDESRLASDVHGFFPPSPEA